MPPYCYIQPFPPKILSPTSTIQSSQAVPRASEYVSLVWTDAVVISPCFPKARTGITAFTITDSQSLRLIKLLYCNSSLWWRCSRSKWETIHSTHSHTLNLLSLLPGPTNYHKTSHAPGNQLFNSFKFSILIYYSYLLPLLCLEKLLAIELRAPSN